MYSKALLRHLGIPVDEKAGPRPTKKQLLDKKSRLNQALLNSAPPFLDVPRGVFGEAETASQLLLDALGANDGTGGTTTAMSKSASDVDDLNKRITETRKLVESKGTVEHSQGGRVQFLETWAR